MEKIILTMMEFCTNEHSARRRRSRNHHDNSNIEKIRNAIKLRQGFLVYAKHKFSRNDRFLYTAI